MKVKIKRAPDSVWFGYVRMTPLLSDLGDIIFFICGVEIAVWYR
jgi:hypothetical protein